MLQHGYAGGHVGYQAYPPPPTAYPPPQYGHAHAVGYSSHGGYPPTSYPVAGGGYPASGYPIAGGYGGSHAVAPLVAGGTVAAAAAYGSEHRSSPVAIMEDTVGTPMAMAAATTTEVTTTVASSSTDMALATTASSKSGSDVLLLNTLRSICLLGMALRCALPDYLEFAPPIVYSSL